MLNIEWTNSSKIANFFSQILVFQIEKILEIFQFGKFKKICYLENSKNLRFEKFQKLPIWKVPKIFNLENSKNCQSEKFRKFSI